MTGPQKIVEDYFQQVELAFGALDQIFETEGAWVQRHNLLYEVFNGHLKRLRQAFQCWQDYARFARAFRIDTKESGFPVYQHVLQLTEDRARAAERRNDLPTPGQIRDEMVELLLKYKQMPHDLQVTMAERLYFDAVAKDGVLRTFARPMMLRHSWNPRSKRPYYLLHWAAYDGSSNLPLVYVLAVEDSSEDAPKPEKKKKKRRGPWGDTEVDVEPDGYFPNQDLRAAFEKFAEGHSSYSLNLTSIATALDEDFPTLHPKQLRRFILGPLYVGGLTDHNEQVQRLLDRAQSKTNNWVLTWTLQELYSKEEVPAKRGIWGGSPAKEIFHIDTDDIDCAQQGVSALERHALVPHEIYQAAYAEGRAGEIFRDYQCYIASGEHIIRHV